MDKNSRSLTVLRRNRRKHKQYQKRKQANWLCRLFYSARKTIITSTIGRRLCKAYRWLQGPLAVFRTFSTLYTLAVFITWMIGFI